MYVGQLVSQSTDSSTISISPKSSLALMVLFLWSILSHSASLSSFYVFIYLCRLRGRYIGHSIMAWAALIAAWTWYIARRVLRGISCYASSSSSIAPLLTYSSLLLHHLYFLPLHRPCLFCPVRPDEEKDRERERENKKRYRIHVQERPKRRHRVIAFL